MAHYGLVNWINQPVVWAVGLPIAPKHKPGRLNTVPTGKHSWLRLLKCPACVVLGVRTLILTAVSWILCGDLVRACGACESQLPRFTIIMQRFSYVATIIRPVCVIIVTQYRGWKYLLATRELCQPIIIDIKFCYVVFWSNKTTSSVHSITCRWVAKPLNWHSSGWIAKPRAYVRVGC